MNARAVTTPALLSLLCGLALAVPALACPLQTAKSSSPIVLAADQENEAVLEDLRPDEVPAGEEATPPKTSSEEGHGKHENAGDLENEAIQKDMAPDTVPSGE
jgi:hypothetical protein